MLVIGEDRDSKEEEEEEEDGEKSVQATCG